MFDIYYNGSCVCGGYETDDRAAHVTDMIIKQNNGEILAAGHDGNNWWWVARFYDANGFAEYGCFSVCKKNKKNA